MTYQFPALCALYYQNPYVVMVILAKYLGGLENDYDHVKRLTVSGSLLRGSHRPTISAKKCNQIVDPFLLQAHV